MSVLSSTACCAWLPSMPSRHANVRRLRALQARDEALEGKAAEEARLFKLQVELAEAQKAAAGIPDLEKELSRFRCPPQLLSRLATLVPCLASVDSLRPVAACSAPEAVRGCAGCWSRSSATGSWPRAAAGCGGSFQAPPARVGAVFRDQQHRGSGQTSCGVLTVLLGPAPLARLGRATLQVHIRGLHEAPAAPAMYTLLQAVCRQAACRPAPARIAAAAGAPRLCVSPTCLFGWLLDDPEPHGAHAPRSYCRSRLRPPPRLAGQTVALGPLKVSPLGFGGPPASPCLLRAPSGCCQGQTRAAAGTWSWGNQLLWGCAGRPRDACTCSQPGS